MRKSFSEWGIPHGIAGQSFSSDLKVWEKELSTIPFYREFISGPQGATFEIFQEKHHTKQDMDKAKIWLKNNMDVVRITVVCEK